MRGTLADARALAATGRLEEARSVVTRILGDDAGDRSAREYLATLDLLAAPPAGWVIGGVIHDRWEVFGSARGGMGEVWFLRDRAWDGMELVAKSFVVDAGEALASEAVQLFRRESQVWLDLGAHPNIVSGFYTLELDGALRFFMEYVPGRSLAAWLQDAGRLELRELLDQGIQLASALAYIHSRGVAHRDVKPANCLVMPDGTLRLTDFGLAKHMPEADVTAATRVLAVEGGVSAAGAGTPFYMAPEQWGALGDAGPPADVYALGIVLYELANGAVPFGADRASWEKLEGLPPGIAALVAAPSPMPQLVMRRLHEQARPPRLEVPDEVAALAALCLAKAPGDRPDAEAVRDVLIGAYERYVGPYPRAESRSLAPSEIGENNRAVSYAVMNEPRKARAILDDILAREPTSLFPYINRARLAIADGTVEPATAADRFTRQVLPAHPGLEQDREVAAFSDEVARYLLAHPARVLAIAPVADGLVSLDATGAVRRWDHGGRAMLLAEVADATSLACARGSTFVAAGERFVILDAAARARELGLPARATVLASAPGGVVIGDVEGGLTRWSGERGVALRGLRGVVRGLAACATSELIAAAGDEAFAVWDPTRPKAPVFVDRRPALTCLVHGGWGIAITGSGDGEIRMWNLATGSSLGVLTGHGGGVTALAFTPDGRLASAGADGTIRTWDVAARRELARVNTHVAPIRALAIEADRWIATASDDASARRTPLVRRPGEPRLVVRKDLPVLARRRRDAELAEVMSALERRDAGAPVAAAELRARHPELHRDHQLAAAEHAARIANGAPRGVGRVSIAWSRRLGFAPSRLAVGARIAVAGGDGVHVFGPDGAEEVIVPCPSVVDVAWSGDQLAIADRASGIHAITGSASRTLPWRGKGEPRAVAAGGATILASGWSGGLVSSHGCVVTWPDGRPREVQLAGETCLALAMSRDGRRAAVAADDGTVRLLAPPWRGSETTLRADDVVALSLVGEMLLVATVRGWSLWHPPFREAATRGPAIALRDACTTPFAVAAATEDGAIALYGLTDGAPWFRRPAHFGGMRIASNAEGTRLFTAGDDRMLHAWRVDYTF